MKIVCISDTHTKHMPLILPEGDMIIHAGDISTRGFKYEIEDFLEWFSALNYKYKIFIAGNHDFGFQDYPKYCKGLLQHFPDIIYLENSGVKIEGINIWGSPVQPTYCYWAFNVERGSNIKAYWDSIPINTDILITHGPAFGFGDQLENGARVGCEDLALSIQQLKPKYHVFGHIHCGYGTYTNEHTTFINASVLNEQYQLTNEPITFTL